MTRVNESVPVVEVDRVAEKPVGECLNGCIRFLVCSPNCSFVAMAEPFAVVKSNSSSVGCHPNKCDAEGVEDMHFGVDENFFGNGGKIGFSNEAGQCVSDGRRLCHRFFLKVRRFANSII